MHKIDDFWTQLAYHKSASWWWSHVGGFAFTCCKKCRWEISQCAIFSEADSLSLTIIPIAWLMNKARVSLNYHLATTYNFTFVTNHQNMVLQSSKLMRSSQFCRIQICCCSLLSVSQKRPLDCLWCIIAKEKWTKVQIHFFEREESISRSKTNQFSLQGIGVTPQKIRLHQLW